MTCFWVLNCCLQTTKVRLRRHVYFLLINYHTSEGAQDRNKRVVHVANTEQRIAFKEVTLIPKAPKEQETSKGKDMEGTNTVNLEETSKDSFLTVDRIIGLSAPAGRAPRKKKTTPSTSATKPKAKAKGKEKAGTSKASNAKGKEKEVFTEDVPMDEDALETNNIDDIYMDE